MRSQPAQTRMEWVRIYIHTDIHAHIHINMLPSLRLLHVTTELCFLRSRGDAAIPWTDAENEILISVLCRKQNMDPGHGSPKN